MTDSYDDRLSGRATLRQLRYFVAVAEELHFGRAATRLTMAQPPLSQQIKRLEDHVGVRLLERDRRNVSLTDAGRVFLQDARSVLEAVDGAARRARRVAAGEEGELTVAFAHSVMAHVLPVIIRRFREEAPDVRLELRELSTAAQLSGVLAGELDLGFTREPLPDPGLLFHTVVREPLVVALPAGHPLASRVKVDVTELAGEPFVLFPPDVAAGLHARVLEVCSAAGFAPRVVQESREIHTTLSLVSVGVGVTIVPGHSTDVGRPGVVFRPLTPAAEARVVVVRNRERSRAVVDRFLALVLRMVEERGEEPAPGPARRPTRTDAAE